MAALEFFLLLLPQVNYQSCVSQYSILIFICIFVLIMLLSKIQRKLPKQKRFNLAIDKYQKAFAAYQNNLNHQKKKAYCQTNCFELWFSSFHSWTTYCQKNSNASAGIYRRAKIESWRRTSFGIIDTTGDRVKLASKGFSYSIHGKWNGNSQRRSEGDWSELDLKVFRAAHWAE